ncbi:MAG TPA: class I SAM-dependent methyltransferase [Prolixibacteraceae bacterium]|nr:class I SAM-dependent methyltransferase [Prolixibacteraceae bacterium]
MDEIEQIRMRYERRKNNSSVPKGHFYFDYFMQSERELVYAKIIHTYFDDFSNVKILEVGAGTGINLHFFIRQGFRHENIFANELLDDRIKVLNEKFPAIRILPGDASLLRFEQEFDIVLQSTVFTSILDEEFKTLLAEKMWNMKKESGIILWYDFMYDNPRNRDVKGISKRQIHNLFPKAEKISFCNVTLAPFIGRRTGRYYPVINAFFPFLRTHTIALIR